MRADYGAPDPPSANHSPPQGLTPHANRSDLLLARLARLSGHLVIALIVLVVIGGATRVMEAGLACPDWPLCYGALMPGRQMNLQVFLEWFHRLDAFVVGIALLIQGGVSLRERKSLPAWFPFLSVLALVLVAVQAGLGALTVVDLLPASIVTAHLGTALLLLALTSAMHQGLIEIANPSHAQRSAPISPAWGWCALLPVFFQCLLGGAMASQWAAERCLDLGESCRWLLLHRQMAYGASFAVALLSACTWILPSSNPRLRLLVGVSFGLVITQIVLGVTTLRLGLDVPAVTIAHQLVASLLIASLAAFVGLGLPAASPSLPTHSSSSFSEVSHG